MTTSNTTATTRNDAHQTDVAVTGDRDGSGTAESTRALATVTPAVDILERDDAYVVVADMPGVVPDQLDIHLERDRLTLAGVSDVDGLDAFRYERAFRVMRGLDPDRVAATYRQGVLTVTLPKPATQVPRQITVTAG